eukprot:GHVN01009310.1.p1 GENE.GHVN01009310.1~~GHVN01009310.1.p1  ORF type:complete len:280 (-),score=69.46 GHVN01009310.1:95-934(-)
MVFNVYSPTAMRLIEGEEGPETYHDVTICVIEPLAAPHSTHPTHIGTVSQLDKDASLIHFSPMSVCHCGVAHIDKTGASSIPLQLHDLRDLSHRAEESSQSSVSLGARDVTHPINLRHLTTQSLGCHMSARVLTHMSEISEKGQAMPSYSDLLIVSNNNFFNKWASLILWVEGASFIITLVCLVKVFKDDLMAKPHSPLGSALRSCCTSLNHHLTRLCCCLQMCCPCCRQRRSRVSRDPRGGRRGEGVADVRGVSEVVGKGRVMVVEEWSDEEDDLDDE